MYAPKMRLAVDDASGPVFVTVTYEVVPKGARRVSESRAAGGPGTSAHRRGALVRLSDAAAPQRFVEMFIVPSWQEHVRQHERRP